MYYGIYDNKKFPIVGKRGDYCYIVDATRYDLGLYDFPIRPTDILYIPALLSNHRYATLDCSYPTILDMEVL